MLVKFKCKKCEKEGYIDIGNLQKIEAMSQLNKSFGKGFECFVGNHRELSSIFNYYDIDWDNPIEGEAKTEDMFYQGLISDFDEVYTTSQLTEKYDVCGFMGGNCLVSSKDNEDDMKTMLFFTSPQGKRYYVYGLKGK